MTKQQRLATVSRNRNLTTASPQETFKPGRSRRLHTKLQISFTPQSNPTDPASSHPPSSGTKRKRSLNCKTGTQVDEEPSDHRLSSKRRRLPPSQYELSEANMSLLEKQTGGETTSLKRSLSRRSIASSEIDTARSQRSSTATSRYRYKALVASQIHLHAEIPKDIEVAVNEIINSTITEQRQAEISIISQQFSNSCRENVRAYSGEDDFIFPLCHAIKALDFEHLCIHRNADWREELKPRAPRDLQFSSSFMAVVDPLATEDAPASPRKRQQQQSTGTASVSPQSSSINVSTLAPANDSQGSSTMPPPPTFPGKKDRPSIKTPRPDISMGIKLPALTSALSSQNLNAIKAQQFLQFLEDEIVEQVDGSPEPMLIPIPAPRAADLAFPFAVVEGKAYSTGKQIFEAENQAAGSAACGLKIQLDLDDLVEHARAHSGTSSASLKVEPPLFFSICTEGPIHELWVHWITVEDDVRMFQSKLVDSCNALLLRQAKDFLSTLNNVASWGTGPFMKSVVERLGIVAKVATRTEVLTRGETVS